MINLHVWLKLRGIMLEDGLWAISKYERVRELLMIWGGPWIENEKKFVVAIDFDGHLTPCDYSVIRNELWEIRPDKVKELEQECINHSLTSAVEKQFFLLNCE